MSPSSQPSLADRRHINQIEARRIAINARQASVAKDRRGKQRFMRHRREPVATMTCRQTAQTECNPRLDAALPGPSAAEIRAWIDEHAVASRPASSLVLSMVTDSIHCEKIKKQGRDLVELHSETIACLRRCDALRESNQYYTRRTHNEYLEFDKKFPRPHTACASSVYDSFVARVARLRSAEQKLQEQVDLLTARIPPIVSHLYQTQMTLDRHWRREDESESEASDPRNYYVSYRYASMYRRQYTEAMSQARLYPDSMAQMELRLLPPLDAPDRPDNLRDAFVVDPELVATAVQSQKKLVFGAAENDTHSEAAPSELAATASDAASNAGLSRDGLSHIPTLAEYVAEQHAIVDEVCYVRRQNKEDQLIEDLSTPFKDHDKKRHIEAIVDLTSHRIIHWRPHMVDVTLDPQQLRVFVHNALRLSSTSYTLLIGMLEYMHRVRAKVTEMDRLGQPVPEILASGTSVFMGSLILAHKYLVDLRVRMSGWSQVFDIPKSRCCELELAVMKALDWNVHLSLQTFTLMFNTYGFMARKTCLHHQPHLETGLVGGKLPGYHMNIPEDPYSPEN